MKSVAPSVVAVRGLGEDFTAAGFHHAGDASPEPRPWTTWPRELLRDRLLPPVPRIAVGSVWAHHDLRRLEAREPAAALLFRLFTLGEAVSRAQLTAHVPATAWARIAASGLIDDGDTVRARFRIVPLHGLFILADFPRARTALANDYVRFGLDSAQLATMIAGEGGSGDRALDLCTGGGVQALMLAARFANVEGVDVNPRAIAFARANAALNGLEDRVTFRAGNLFDSSEGRYDLIVANPPFMLLPPEEARVNLTGDGGDLGIEITLRILQGLDQHLADDGRAFVYTQAPRIGGRCALASAAAERLGSRKIAIDLEEIHRGYWSAFRAFYEQMGVEWLSCYRVRVTRAGRGSVTVRPMRGWRDAVLRATVAAERRGA